MYTATYLLRVFPLTKTRRMSAWIVFLVAHVVLAGDCYCAVLLGSPFQSGSTNPSLVAFLNFWKTLRDYWIVVLFIFDILPSIWFVHIMFPPKLTVRERVLFLYHQHGVFLLLLLLQFALIGIYYFISFLQSRTSLLGDDRTFNAMTSLLCVFLAMHCLLNCFLIESTKLILKNVKQASFESEIAEDPVNFDKIPAIPMNNLLIMRSSQFRSAADGNTFQTSGNSNQLGTIQLREPSSESNQSYAAYYQSSGLPSNLSQQSNQSHQSHQSNQSDQGDILPLMLLPAPNRFPSRNSSRKGPEKVQRKDSKPK
jgi:hypothetical protein